MKRLLVYVPIVSVLLSLIGCSGSSSSGASTSYAGQYDGTTTLTLTGLGQTASQTFRARIIVGVDGQVTAANPESSASGECGINPNKTYISGNTAYNSGNFSCSFSGIGTCQVSGWVRAVFSNDAVSVNAAYDIRCPQGLIKGSETGYLKKTV